ncbi:MAG: Abortive infection protein [Candidatus Peregrinibacteria bacterium Greene0416_19]|nr:MAG: Abortive infection protein [Candidatus Peregrinibacteria bacterium Greene0416_19]
MDFLVFRRAWSLSPVTQVVAIVILYLLSIVVGYVELHTKGTFFGYPLSISILFVPIYEEIIFRGFILEALAKRYSPVASVLLSSLLFALWHAKNIFFVPVNDVIMQMIYTGCVIGPIFGFMAMKKRTVWPSVILHYLNNIVSRVPAIFLV